MFFLVIVGAGGLGRELISQARSDSAHGRDWVVAGFLDSRGQDILPPQHDLPVVGDPLSYRPRSNEIFLGAIGDPAMKRHFLAPLIAQNAPFMDLRTEVRIGERSTWETGCVFGRNVYISTDCAIGEHVYIDYSTNIGHDVVVGAYSHIGARCFIAGNVEIGADVTIHPMSAVASGVKIGAGAIIGMGSVVLRDVPNNATVMGNPARILTG